MVEKNLIINHRTIKYKGLFLFQDIFKIINENLDKLGYQKREKKSEETISPSGKKILIELRPFKEKTSYVTLMIKIKILLENVTEVTKEVNNTPKKFQQGEATIIFDSWTITDYASRWGMKPFFFFLKAVINKYIYSFPSEDNYANELISDTTQLHKQLNALFKLYKYKIEGKQPEVAGNNVFTGFN